MFLDEPTAGIDPVARRELWDLLFRSPRRASRSSSPPTTWTRPSAAARSATCYMSKLLVTGTPEQLKALPQVNPPDKRLVEVQTGRPARALQWLLDAAVLSRARPSSASPCSACSFAATSRRRGRAEAGRGRFPDAAVRDVRPSLEDVFVTLTE